VDLLTSDINRIPAQEAFFVDATLPTPTPNRWIQAESPESIRHGLGGQITLSSVALIVASVFVLSR
jgi:hypothetical protein